MSNKIGWQKYEDMIKKQISSPLASLMMSMSLGFQQEEMEEDADETELDFETEEQEILAIPVPQNMYEQISLVSNYDCWIGHTNFNLTPSLKDKLEKVQGVEVLKICSRYRFFIGVGQMFDFKDVRKLIEQTVN